MIGNFKRAPKGTPTRERLLMHALKTESGCWLWPGTKSSGGYGKTLVDGRYAAVHRLSYQTFVGPIPDGATIDHLCFTPACYNPGHLRALDHHENSRLQRSALASHCRRGHAFSPENTWVSPSNGRRKCKTCQQIRIEARRAARTGVAA